MIGSNKQIIIINRKKENNLFPDYLFYIRYIYFTIIAYTFDMFILILLRLYNAMKIIL